MTQQISISEARTHFSQIRNKAEKGDVFIITKRGEPVAIMGPLEQKNEPLRLAAKKHGIGVLK